MQITKAVITAAGRGPREYPTSDGVQKAMLPLVDRDGVTKPTLQIIAEEAIESGIESICVVVAPGDEARYRRHFRAYAAGHSAESAGDPARRIADLEQRLHFAVQAEPDGFGHAVWCARDFAGPEPFLLLVSDHVYVSHEPRRCARQLLDLAHAEGCAVSAVQSTREHLIGQYGTIAGRRIGGRHDVYVVDEVVEKPTPTLAELRLAVPGLRAGHYLCFFGMHVISPAVMAALAELVDAEAREAGGIQLTAAQNLAARRETYLALETRGSRHNLGVKYGHVEAQIALALAGADRQEVLAGLLEAVVKIEQKSG